MVGLVGFQILVLVGFEYQDSVFQLFDGHSLALVHILLEINTLEKLVLLLVERARVFKLTVLCTFDVVV